MLYYHWQCAIIIFIIIFINACTNIWHFNVFIKTNNAALFDYYCDLCINANLPLSNDAVKMYRTIRLYQNSNLSPFTLNEIDK